MSDKKLFLLDGHALIFRAHYAFINRPLINSKGVNTSAIMGFVRSLWDILQNQKPSHIAVSFDLSKQTFRNDIYPEYKANRDETPEDIIIAFPYIKKIIKAFNIPVVVKDGFEADDVLGTLAKQAEKEDFEVYLVTPDKDFAQLVSENIFMFKPNRQGNGVDILGVPEVLEKWQINRIDQVIDVLGLQGDSVDNIPGVPGVGPKTAVKLLASYDSVEGVIANAEELKGKQKERIIEFAEQALLSKRLATIDTEVPVNFDSNTFKVEPFDHGELSKIFKELEFRTLAKAILGSVASSGTQTSLFSSETADQKEIEPEIKKHDVAEKTYKDMGAEYICVQEEADLKALAELLLNAPYFCFDTETTSLDVNTARLVGIAFAMEEGKAWYVPIPEQNDKSQAILDILTPAFTNPSSVKIGQNIKYDISVLAQHGIHIEGQLEDTMIMHYLLEPELRHNMDYLSETYLKYKPISIESLIGPKGKTQLSMRNVDVEKVTIYAAEDADITLQLRNLFLPQIKEEGLASLYQDVEAPLIRILSDIETTGVRVDVPFLENYSQQLAHQILEHEKTIYDKAGTTFNIASPKQVGEVLFDKLKIPYRWSKTKSGQYSTSEERLRELAVHHDVVEDILSYRMLAKLKSTYVDALPKLVNERSGRIHSSFNQALAATGRLSSNNPNLQNIPIRTPEGRRIREAFIPGDDNKILLAADYSQVELRLIASISEDEAMMDAFIKGQDIHRATAARVFGVDYDAVTKDQRRTAKTVNFSIIYGAGSQNLSRQLDLKRSEAKDLIEQYFSQYSGLKAYMERTVRFARENGYVETLLGRKRKLRDINSRNNMARSGAERIAINTPIQGSAADLIKLAMINIHDYLVRNKMKSKMIMQVHDELVFDMDKGELEELRPLIEEKMKSALPGLKVPIVVDSGIGKNWLEAH